MKMRMRTLKVWLAAVAMVATALPAWGQPVTPALPSTPVTRGLLRSTNQADFRLRLGLVDTNVAVVAATAINPNHLSTNAGVLELKTGGTLPPMNAAALTNITASNSIVFGTITTNLLSAEAYEALAGGGSSTTVELLDCTAAEVVRELTNRVAHVLLKSNANYNALIVANGQTNTVTGALVWVDAQPLGTTNWVIRW